MDIKTKFPKYRENEWKDELNNLSSTKIKNIVNTYKDNDIQDANYTSKKDASEISIDCKEYILLSQRYFIGVGYDFWNW